MSTEGRRYQSADRIFADRDQYGGLEISTVFLIPIPVWQKNSDFFARRGRAGLVPIFFASALRTSAGASMSEVLASVVGKIRDC